MREETEVVNLGDLLESVREDRPVMVARQVEKASEESKSAASYLVTGFLLPNRHLGLRCQQRTWASLSKDRECCHLSSSANAATCPYVLLFPVSLRTHCDAA